MPKNPYNKLLFDHIDGYDFFLVFWVQILSYLPLLQEGTTAEFPALGSSHNRPCKNTDPDEDLTLAGRATLISQSDKFCTPSSWWDIRINCRYFRLDIRELTCFGIRILIFVFVRHTMAHQWFWYIVSHDCVVLLSIHFISTSTTSFQAFNTKYEMLTMALSLQINKG